MNTSEIYSQIIIQNIIKKYLEQGQVPTLQQIEDEFAAQTAGVDLTTSEFTSSEWKVIRKESASASKYNEMNDQIHQDLNVLYKSLLDSSDRTIQLFARWQAKANALESRLQGLEDRIARLLLLTTDTSGFFSIVGDSFNNTSLIDLDRSSLVAIDLKQNIVTLERDNPSTTIPDRIFFNDLTSDQVIFRPLTRNSIISVTNQQSSEPRFAFRDQNQSWLTNITTKEKVSPMTTELLLSLNDTVTISKIDIFLHSSQSNSVTTVTPLYSVDGINFSNLPVLNVAQQGLDKVTFQFPDTEFKYLKFILEKNNFDYQDSGLYIYEFGAKEIALYHEEFNASSNTFGALISKPLSITKPDNTLIEFNKLTLEVCEGISSDTFLDYFVSVAHDLNGVPNWLTISGFSASLDPDLRLWYPITPLNREEAIHSKILDFASLSSSERDGIGISYDRDGVTLISPDSSYTILSESGGVVSYNAATASGQRYIFSHPNQKLLDLQIDLNASIDQDSLVLWRNVGSKGIDPSDTTKLVRGTQAGWEFSAPYYLTEIKIQGANGMSINVGHNPITIDNVNYTGVIGPDVLSPGNHSIKVHQDFWNPVVPNLTTLDDLKANDRLYPFNQKLLIEGYLYDATYPSTSEKFYSGVDRFAGILMDKVSIFDFVNNVNAFNFTKFSIDTDVDNTVPSNSYIFLVNTDGTKADFVNESFVLEFNLTNQLYSYLALKAEFRTANAKLTPVLDEYKIKLGF